MRFLADESCDANITRALRNAGHDILDVADVAPRAEDSMVIALAVKESRMLLTEDKDFGQLVFASGSPTNGVVLFRYPHQARSRVIHTFVDLVKKKGEQLMNRFIVVQPGRIRINPPLGSL